MPKIAFEQGSHVFSKSRLGFAQSALNLGFPKCGSGFEDWEFFPRVGIRVRGLGIFTRNVDQGSRIGHIFCNADQGSTIGNLSSELGSGFEDFL